MALFIATGEIRFVFLTKYKKVAGLRNISQKVIHQNQGYQAYNHKRLNCKPFKR